MNSPPSGCTLCRESFDDKAMRLRLFSASNFEGSLVQYGQEVR